MKKSKTEEKEVKIYNGTKVEVTDFIKKGRTAFVKTINRVYYSKPEGRSVDSHWSYCTPFFEELRAVNCTPFFEELRVVNCTSFFFANASKNYEAVNCTPFFKELRAVNRIFFAIT